MTTRSCRRVACWSMRQGYNAPAVVARIALDRIGSMPDSLERRVHIVESRGNVNIDALTVESSYSRMT